MASGVIDDIVATDKSSYIKFASGIMMAWGTTFVSSASSSSSSFLPYTGSLSVDLTPFGFVEVFTVISNPRDSAAYWNSMISSVSNASINITLGGDIANGKNVAWLAIGRWE